MSDRQKQTLVRHKCGVWSSVTAGVHRGSSESGQSVRVTQQQPSLPNRTQLRK